MSNLSRKKKKSSDSLFTLAELFIKLIVDVVAAIVYLFAALFKALPVGEEKSFATNEYNQYAPGQLTPERYTRAEAKQLAPIYLKQFGESAKIIDNTTNPETFFYRFGFALQRLTELEKMQKLVKFTGNKPSEIKQKMISGKQECIRQLIDRMKDKLEHKLSSLKTEKAIANNIIKFNNELEQYHSEMDAHTLSYKEAVISSLKDKYNVK